MNRRNFFTSTIGVILAAPFVAKAKPVKQAWAYRGAQINIVGPGSETALVRNGFRKLSEIETERLIRLVRGID